MRRFVWLSILGMAFLPGLAHAAGEFVFGADAMTTYDDNIFNTSRKEQDDVSFLFGPHLEFRSDPGDLNYSISYDPMFEAFVDTDGIDGWRHRAQGRLDYRPNARTAVYATESFSIMPYVLEGFDSSNSSMYVNNAALDATREDVKRNYFDVGVEHFLTPRLRFNLDVRTGLLDGQSGSDVIADQQSYTIEAALTRAMTKRDKLSLGVQIGLQDFEGIREQQNSDAQTYYLYGGWEHQWSRDLALSVRVGPSYMKNNARPENTLPTYGITENEDGSFSVRTTTGCKPGAVPGTYDGVQGCGKVNVLKSDPNYAAVKSVYGSRTGPAGADPSHSVDDSTLSFFAEVEFIKRWERSSLGFHYLRSTTSSNLAGFESSTIQDMIELQGRHQFMKNLNGVLTLTWNQYESATNLALPIAVGVDSALGTIPNAYMVSDIGYSDTKRRIDVETYRAALSLRYQLDRRSTILFGTSYLYRASESSFEAASTDKQLRSDVFRVWLGYSFRFEPIDL